MKLDFKVNWEPLEGLSEKYSHLINCGDYMYMGTVVELEQFTMLDSGVFSYLEINLYKHIVTRGYINIDSEGACWQYRDGKYSGIAEDKAIEMVTG